MTTWQESEKKFQEGRYIFRIESDPVHQPYSWFNKKKGKYMNGQRLVLELLAMAEDEEFSFTEKIPTWDDRYDDIKKALGIEHTSDLDPTGMTFEADLEYVAGKTGGKKYPRLTNIKAVGSPEGGEDVPPSGEDESAPF